MTGDLILITGANGFIAKHCILAALERGFRVRGTIRRPDVAAQFTALAEQAGVSAEQFDIVQVDLASSDGWDRAVAGCRFVLHAASPFPLHPPRDPARLIAPAREGTLHVLRAAAQAGVERTVVTSSIAAITGGQSADRVHTEAEWSQIGSGLGPYASSKILAERAAWDFMATDASEMSLLAINPSATLGPALDRHISTSGRLVELLLSGKLPLLPRLAFAVVDVRDVAEAHMRALEVEAAGGERIIAASDTLWVRDVAATLAEAYPDRRIPRREVPDAIVRLAAKFVPMVADRVSELGAYHRLSNEKARTLLGMQFRSAREAVLAMAQSLIRFGVV